MRTIHATKGIALGALASAVGSLALDKGRPRRRPVPGSPPGADEENSHGLPDGHAIWDALRSWLADQRDTVLADLDRPGATLPKRFPVLHDATAMASAMFPVVSGYWLGSGQVTRARLGLDPLDWQVSDRATRATIRRASRAFCRSSNETTVHELNVALDRLMQEFAASPAPEGEAVPRWRAIVKEVFEKAGAGRAGRTARNEAARAAHAASLEAARRSGVVDGKVWLLSANACPLCGKLAEQSRTHPITLEADFGKVSDHPEYAAIAFPPAHPGCHCSITYRLSDEYQAQLESSGPPGGWFEPGPLGPEPRAYPGVTTRPVFPAVASRHPAFPHFGPSMAEVAIDDRAGVSPEQVLEHAREILGRRDPSLRDLASLVGAPDDARLVIVRSDPGMIELHVEHPLIRAIEYLEPDERGRPIIDAFSIDVEARARGQGIATRVFGRQAEQARRLGVANVQGMAVRDADHNGYYTWPRLGWDGPVPGPVRALLPPSLKDATQVSDLIRNEPGKRWWREYGTSIPVVFDLTEGSLSWRILAEYLAERGETGLHSKIGSPRQRLRRLRRMEDVPASRHPEVVLGREGRERPRGMRWEIELGARDEAILDRIWDRIGSHRRDSGPGHSH